MTDEAWFPFAYLGFLLVVVWPIAHHAGKALGERIFGKKDPK